MSSNEENDNHERNRKHKDKNGDEERRRRRRKKKEKYENRIEDDRNDKEYKSSKGKKNSGDENSDDGGDKIMRASRHIGRKASQDNKDFQHRTEINLWDLAVEQMEQKDKTRDIVKNDQSVIFLGSKGSGKTTLMMKCLGRNEDNIKPTIGIDYTFVRKNKMNQQDESVEMGHLWEVGGGVMLGKLIDNLINTQSIRDTSVVMVVDLSDPRTLWVTVEKWLELLRSRVNDVIRKDDNGNKLKSDLEERARGVYTDDHTDMKLLDLQLLPVFIVANKYDILQNMEGEDRRLVCKALRFVAHRIGAHLQFCSATKMESLVGKVKTFINHRLFETPLSIPMQTAHNKPLTILAGQDSFQDIGMPSTTDGDTGRLNAKTPFDLWKYAFNKKFPQQDLKKLADDEDPTLDPQFREPEIDAMKLNKDQELKSYMNAQEGRKLLAF